MSVAASTAVSAPQGDPPLRLPAPAAQDPADEGLPLPRRHVAVAAVLAAVVLVVLDAAVANIALPTIARALAVSPAASVWVITSYQLALVVALLPCAALGESLGYRRVFVTGVVVFTAASALCAFAPTLPALAVARFVQGLGGAAIMSLGVALLRFACPQRLIGRAIGWIATAVALSSAAGPGVGSAILAIAPWQWIFAVNIPIGAIVLAASSALPRARPTRRPFDSLSAALNAAAFGALVIGADLGARRPVLAAALIAGSAALFAVLVRRERLREAPLIPLDLLRAASLRLSVVASILCFTGQMMGLVALTFYLQVGLGRGAFTTGLYMMAWPLTVAAVAPVAGALSDRVSTVLPCAVGGVGLGAGLALAAAWPARGQAWILAVFMGLCGLGFGLFQTPNNRNMLLAAPRERSGAVGGMQGTARLIGQTAGAIAMTLLLRLLPVDLAPRAGLALAAALAALAGAVSALRLPRAEQR